MVPETPQRTGGDNQHNRPVELPTPSSTSKLERVQPIDNMPGLSFTPQPQQNQEALKSQARAQRYQIEDNGETDEGDMVEEVREDGNKNDEKFFKDNYSDDFEDDDPQDATVIKKSSNPLNKSN